MFQKAAVVGVRGLVRRLDLLGHAVQVIGVAESSRILRRAHRVTAHFLGRGSEDPVEVVVERERIAVHVIFPVAGMRHLQGGGQARLAPAQRLLSQFALRDVVADPLDLNQLALLVEDRAIRPPSPPDLAVGPGRAILAHHEGILRTEGRQLVQQGLAILRQHVGGEGPADHFLALLSVILAARFVDEGHDAVRKKPADAVRLGFHDGPETLLVPPQDLVRAPVYQRIADGRRDIRQHGLVPLRPGALDAVVLDENETPAAVLHEDGNGKQGDDTARQKERLLLGGQRSGGPAEGVAAGKDRVPA